MKSKPFQAHSPGESLVIRDRIRGEWECRAEIAEEVVLQATVTGSAFQVK